MDQVTGGVGLHAGQALCHTGAPVERAAGALILLHGRGGEAAGMLDLARLLVGADIACLAPQASGHTWYPRRFIEPVAHNEPDLSSALSVVADLVTRLIASGVPASRIGLAGFSQGACLTLEYTRRHGGVAGVLGFSGGLIGDTVGVAGPADRLAGLPVLLGCSARDPHIPLARVHQSADLLAAMGAQVTTRIAPGGGHEVTRDEIAQGRALLQGVYATAP